MCGGARPRKVVQKVPQKVPQLEGSAEGLRCLDRRGYPGVSWVDLGVSWVYLGGILGLSWVYPGCIRSVSWDDELPRRPFFARLSIGWPVCLSTSLIPNLPEFGFLF